jgi:hypothetical protein
MSKMSIGAMNQLADALENAGFSPEDVTRLRQFQDLKGFKAVLNGQADIKYLLQESKWSEKNGIIYFTVTSDGTTGEQWIARLESRFRIKGLAASILGLKSFKPTTGITYDVAVLKGDVLRYENERTTKNLLKEAKKHKFSTTNAEVACLIREKFSDTDLLIMGLGWIVTMHKPAKGHDGARYLLCSGGHTAGISRFSSEEYFPDSKWGNGYGFAFVVK